MAELNVIYYYYCFLNGMQIPYQTNKSALVEKIAELVENKVML